MCGGGVDLPCIKVRKLGSVKDRKRKIKKKRETGLRQNIEREMEKMVIRGKRADFPRVV